MVIWSGPGDLTPLNIALHRLRKITYLRTSPALPIALLLALALVCVFVNRLPGAWAQNQTSFVPSRTRDKSVDFEIGPAVHRGRSLHFYRGCGSGQNSSDFGPTRRAIDLQKHRPALTPKVKQLAVQDWSGDT